ncbi:WecB/TagA/CpsF family glycosyltransferase [Arthrobacter dokdonensis]|uniref:WecB/TagA/CpsF family glycosyltransferase n=1 Tax=Arthrobacter dokdonellae TaxID=2211210 RepID=UPI001D1323BA|nr:WecB/TagA/CpsF family glycosyltransferase [Arthrobacter dokdonellae]
MIPRFNGNTLGGSVRTSGDRFRPAKQVVLGGTTVNLCEFGDAVADIVDASMSPSMKPLAVVSANLDHVFHFGSGGKWADHLETAGVTWMTLLDGAPLRAKAERLTGTKWPRLAGSDLINPLLDKFESAAVRIGFLGGSASVQAELKRKLALSRPGLEVSGYWSPTRSELADTEASSRLADEIAAAGTDILVVGLGKPRQELWIAQHGARTGARVLLAFGAVVDFLAGRIARAPEIVARAGLEWTWRLALEPRRLANRYLVQGPEAYLRLLTSSGTATTFPLHSAGRTMIQLPLDDDDRDEPVDYCDRLQTRGAENNRFVQRDDLADLTAVIVTFNNANDIDALLDDLRHEVCAQSIKVVIVDNGSSDGTVDSIHAHSDVVVAYTDGNLGYAGGINAALRAAGPRADVIILNPDLRIRPGALKMMRQRLRSSHAAVVVPRLVDQDGTTYPSLRREPDPLKSLGDALLGSRVPRRPAWLSEIDYDMESYNYAHRVDWATGASLLIAADVADTLGPWDERFFLYSEETDFCRRVRTQGGSIWYEPDAVMQHTRGGSGSSPALVALMAINRVRYARKYAPGTYARVTQASVLLGASIRFWQEGHRLAVRHLFDDGGWNQLPGPSEHDIPNRQLHDFPSGTIIIPAHNEENALSRTLDALHPVLATGKVEVIVACNGCTDATSRVASGYDGVRVIELENASKTAALNAADDAATSWPRIYLDADIEIGPAAVRRIFEELGAGQLLAVGPRSNYDDAGAHWAVRSFYRARRRIFNDRVSLWGAGAYALSERGHERLGIFPNVTADDLLVDQLFSASEKAVLDTPPTQIRTPRDLAGLSAVLRRTYRGKAELLDAIAETPDASVPPASRAKERTIQTVRRLAESATSPVSVFDAAVYTALVTAARLSLNLNRHSTATNVWERDESSRAAFPAGDDSDV